MGGGRENKEKRAYRRYEALATQYSRASTNTQTKEQRITTYNTVDQFGVSNIRHIDK